MRRDSVSFFEDDRRDATDVVDRLPPIFQRGGEFFYRARHRGTGERREGPSFLARRRVTLANTRCRPSKRAFRSESKRTNSGRLSMESTRAKRSAGPDNGARDVGRAAQGTPSKTWPTVVWTRGSRGVPRSRG